MHEIRLFVEHLSGICSYLASDHALNLLEGLEGRFPEDKPALLDRIDRYLALPPDDRLLFQLGRRLGLLRDPSDLEDSALRGRAEQLREQVLAQEDGDLETAIRTLAERYL